MDLDEQLRALSSDLDPSVERLGSPSPLPTGRRPGTGAVVGVLAVVLVVALVAIALARRATTDIDVATTPGPAAVEGSDPAAPPVRFGIDLPELELGVAVEECSLDRPESTYCGTVAADVYGDAGLPAPGVAGYIGEEVYVGVYVFAGDQAAYDHYVATYATTPLRTPRPITVRGRPGVAADFVGALHPTPTGQIGTPSFVVTWYEPDHGAFVAVLADNQLARTDPLTVDDVLDHLVVLDEATFQDEARRTSAEVADMGWPPPSPTTAPTVPAVTAPG